MRFFLLLPFFLILAIPMTCGQATFCDQTSTSIATANIFLGSEVAPTLDGLPLPLDTYVIAVYETENGPVCAGYIEWEGENVFLVVNGDDGSGNGYQPAEAYRFFLQFPNGCMVDSVAVTFETDDVFTNLGTFQDGGLSKIASFAAVTRDWLELESTDGLCGDSTAMIEAITSGFFPYTFTWNTGDTTGTLSNLVDGAYQVTVMDRFGCVQKDSAMVGNLEALSLSVEMSQGSNGCEATAIPTGGTAPFVYLWSNGDTTMTALDLPTGDFGVTVIDANGCMAVTTENCTINHLVQATVLETCRVYPNPGDGVFKVEVELHAVQNMQLVVKNMLGEPVWNRAFSGAAIDQIMDLSTQTSGIFVVEIWVENQLVDKRLLLITT